MEELDTEFAVEDNEANMKTRKKKIIYKTVEYLLCP